MCVTIVRFVPLEKMSQHEYAAFLRKIMPVYKSAAGLKRKYFLASDNGSLGIYEWESRKHAEEFYDDSWQAQMKSVAGDSVSVEYARINAVLDNIAGKIDYHI